MLNTLQDRGLYGTKRVNAMEKKLVLFACPSTLFLLPAMLCHVIPPTMPYRHDQRTIRGMGSFYRQLLYFNAFYAKDIDNKARRTGQEVFFVAFKLQG